MAQVINTNIMSLDSQRNLNKTNGAMSTALQRLSSGLRINSAMDDAAGLAVAQKMDSQVRGMTVAMRNASDGVSYAQTADTALSTVSDQLQRMRELATQSLNGTLSDTDRSKIDTEYSALQDEANRIQGAATLNGLSVFSTFSFQVGANAGDTITGTFSSANVTGTSVSTTAGASTALASIDAWLGSVATNRASIGGTQSRLNFTVSYLEGARENQSAAKSRIMDTDFAQETANLTRAQILQQAGTAMVSQANSLPNNVLTLLKG
ncbi:flagellin FliC [Rhodocyclus tenuis]|uniref:flagellin N-terminal helical domain-containing protein n=1 Tax=Rhodocyclus gracilis TaxID=2929842 RepID=UPI001298D762|nr:flagellin [Rhodocyclus gracilis]MRD73056.1 flagellin FliC [Rhodocyclus gracilis]